METIIVILLAGSTLSIVLLMLDNVKLRKRNNWQADIIVKYSEEINKLRGVELK